jgi:hypothetical protein
MGTNCGSKGEEGGGFKNACFVDINQQFDIPNFCQSILSTTVTNDIPQLQSYCDRINGTEWKYDSLSGFCFMNSCDSTNSVNYGFGCCNGCCGIAGRGTVCKRVKYTADPVTCCVQDLTCNPEPGNLFNPKNCYSDPARKNTCATGNRDTITPSCKATLHDWCLGTDLVPNDVTWLDRWIGSVSVNGTTYNAPCVQHLNRNLYNSNNSTLPKQCGPFPEGLPITNEGFAYGEQLLADAVFKYRNQGFILGANPGSAGYNTFQDLLLGICQRNPGICVNSLRTAGASLNTSRLTQNPTAAKLFGCYLPDSEYETYINRYGVPKECTPLCNKSDTIPLIGPDGVTPVPCRSSSCIIDNITIALSQSNVGGSVNFSQVCKNCSSNDPNVVVSCTCLIEGTSVLVANSQIGGNIDFNQHCTGAIQCFSTDEAGNRIEKDCSSSTDPYAEQIALQNRANQVASSNGYLITLGIIIFAIILVIIIYFLVRYRS